MEEVIVMLIIEGSCNLLVYGVIVIYFLIYYFIGYIYYVYANK